MEWGPDVGSWKRVPEHQGLVDDEAKRWILRL